MIACFICYFVHVTSASYHCFMCMYILWLHLEEFRLSIQAELPGLADNAFDWKRMRDVCGRVTPQVLNLIADFQEQPVFFFCERKRKRNINMKGIFKCVPRGLDLFLCDASIHLYSLFLCNFEIMCYIIYCYYVIVLGFRVLYIWFYILIFWFIKPLLFDLSCSISSSKNQHFRNSGEVWTFVCYIYHVSCHNQFDRHPFIFHTISIYDHCQIHDGLLQ